MPNIVIPKSRSDAPCTVKSCVCTVTASLLSRSTGFQGDDMDSPFPTQSYAFPWASKVKTQVLESERLKGHFPPLTLAFSTDSTARVTLQWTDLFEGTEKVLQMTCISPRPGVETPFPIFAPTQGR
ncbi:hypothetical protein CIHG_00550 [Coccidioides immitis H538.4]|uniref:Uncharacterized protein n=1 Tax=Coccidioides immitis H538.4 TaxID=396776 RepID=A0A0J8U6W6_COCIT|nr:hypothetical protein CIHG_00550 [Coccidioides immitis H538.4]